MSGHVRLLLAAFGLLALGGAATALWPAPPEPQIEIVLAEEQDSGFRLAYRLSHPVKELFVGPDLSGARARDWKVLTKGVVLVDDGGDVLKGAAFAAVDIAVRPSAVEFKKQYQPIKPLAAGTMIYTGHFWPYDRTGRRARALFDFAPKRGESVVAFARSEPSFAGWESPYRHPAFVYFGPLAPVSTPDFSLILDGRFPDWAGAHVSKSASAILKTLERLNGASLKTTPDLFVFFEPDADSARLAYSGDALPGQVVLVFKGGGWGDQSPEGTRLIDAALAHEGAHLWQTATRPADADAPVWIHEGAADAIAAEALLAAGRITVTDYEEGLADAQKECGDILLGRSLAGAEREGLWRASYACGRVLAVAATRARGDDSVAAFWRTFDARAKERGYDAELFYTLVAEEAGRPLADRFRRFAHTVFANPSKEAGVLLSLAEADGAE